MIELYPKLKNVKANDKFCLLLEYDNGEKLRYNFENNFNHPFFKPLENLTLFKNVSVNNGLLEWATGQDFCPHTLYEQSELIK